MGLWGCGALAKQHQIGSKALGTACSPNFLSLAHDSAELPGATTAVGSANIDCTQAGRVVRVGGNK